MDPKGWIKKTTSLTYSISTTHNKFLQVGNTEGTDLVQIDRGLHISLLFITQLESCNKPTTLQQYSISSSLSFPRTEAFEPALSIITQKHDLIIAPSSRCPVWSSSIPPTVDLLYFASFNTVCFCLRVRFQFSLVFNW